MKKTTAIITCILFLTFLAGCGQKPNQEAAKSETGSSAQKPVRVSAENTDAAEPAVASAPNGTAFVVWVEHRENKAADVMIAQLDHEGRAKGGPFRVNPNEGEATAWRGDAPTLAVAGDGTIYVGWTARIKDKSHAEDLFISSSRDRGNTFAPPVKVNDDGKAVGHGMHSLAVGPDGRVYVAWLDERNVAKPPASESGSTHKMENMESNREVFIAYSADGGKTFSRNQRIAKDACPCCKTAIAAGPNGRVFAGWRQVLPGEFRHIAVAASVDAAKTFSSPVIVSDDSWKIASCPVSGPALSVSTEGALKVAWYTEGEKAAPGLYWVESGDNAKTFSPATQLAKGETRGMPYLVAKDTKTVRAVWESAESGSPRVMSTSIGEEGNPSALAIGGELPSAAIIGDRLFVAYIAKNNERRSIWIVTSPVAGRV